MSERLYEANLRDAAFCLRLAVARLSVPRKRWSVTRKWVELAKRHVEAANAVHDSRWEESNPRELFALVWLAYQFECRHIGPRWRMALRGAAERALADVLDRLPTVAVD